MTEQQTLNLKKDLKGFTLTEYEDFVSGLASDYTMADMNSKLATAGLGLAGEAGEAADLIKKVLYHGLEFSDEVQLKLKKELSDIMWYVAFAARNVLGVSIQDLIDANVEKLSDRYKTGKFTTAEFMAKESKKPE